jgi:hypothetical protein
MPVPFSRRSGRQVGRTCGTQNAFEQLIRILTVGYSQKEEMSTAFKIMVGVGEFTSY